MTVIALELNDVGVLAADASGVLSPPSPGVALIEGRSIAVGREAASGARLKPRRIHDRFWNDLDTKALKRPFPSHLSTADLVHRHLQQIWSEVGTDAHSVLLVVPGTFDERQLSLLLGIARSCQIPANGLVDAAVAASLGPESGPSNVLHLDLQMHAAVATLLERRRRLSRVRVLVDDRFGLADLHTRWASQIAADFVRTTRFDPLHLAASEQSLYDHLPAWLRVLPKSNTVTVSMEAGGRRYAIELSHEGMVGAVQRQYDNLVETIRAVRPGSAPLNVVVTDRLATLPGLEDHLSRAHETTVAVLQPAAAAMGAVRAADQISAPTESLPFITVLETGADASHDSGTPAGTHPPAAGGRPPTHLVHDSIAYPISEVPFAIGVSIPEDGRGLQIPRTTAGVSSTQCTVFRRGDSVILEDHSTSGTSVNGRRVAGSTELAAGDTVSFGSPDVELLMVSMVD